MIDKRGSIMDNKQLAMEKHELWEGKIEVISRAPLETRDDLCVAYTPGVAEPCVAIQKDENLSFSLTRRGHLVAVITDGTSVLGLGDIGPVASMPVMEGKCALFKAFADVDAFPICVDSTDVDTFVETVRLISKSFGAINLEDISAPRCFEIERRLIEACDIPVFHDDQHGTAIVAAAGVINAAKVTGRQLGNLKIVINGAGAAGSSIAKMLLQMEMGEILLCDRQGILWDGADWMTEPQKELARRTNPQKKQGTLKDALVGADLLIGVSRPNQVTKEMVASMAKDPIIFAMANPVPEILPEEAKAGGAAVVGTGRSDYPNQINNVLAFPGIFKGALQVRATRITEGMKMAAARAIAAMVPEEALSRENILPDALDRRVAQGVADAVAEEAVRTGYARAETNRP